MIVPVLRFSCLYVCRKHHLLYPFSEIPAFDYFITFFFVLDCNIIKSGCLKHPFQFLHGNCTGDSSAVSAFVLFYRFREFTFFEDIRNRKSSSWLQHPEGLLENSLFIWREIDYTVGYDHINRVVICR